MQIATSGQASASIQLCRSVCLYRESLNIGCRDGISSKESSFPHSVLNLSEETDGKNSMS